MLKIREVFDLIRTLRGGESIVCHEGSEWFVYAIEIEGTQTHTTIMLADRVYLDLPDPTVLSRENHAKRIGALELALEAKDTLSADEIRGIVAYDELRIPLHLRSGQRLAVRAALEARVHFYGVLAREVS